MSVIYTPELLAEIEPHLDSARNGDSSALVKISEILGVDAESVIDLVELFEESEEDYDFDI